VDRLLADVPAAVPVVIVGPPLDGLDRAVTFVREDPAGSGPLAGIRAGAQAVRTPLVGVLAADMPFAVPVLREALTRLAEPGPRPPDTPRGDDAGPVRTPTVPRGDPVVPRVDAVVPVDPQGFPQLLCAAYRTDVLHAAFATLGDPAGRPVRALRPALTVLEWPVPAAALADVDTGEQLSIARARAAKEARVMQDWIDAVRATLGLDVTVDLDVVLDLARDAAHNVERPAAPVTTYLLGAAVARGADPAEAAARVSELARAWTGGAA
jgi:hypothetical protein